MGYLSADTRTRSTDESRNTTSTPAISTEARPSDQEENNANEAIRQAAPKSMRCFFKFWSRMGKMRRVERRNAVIYAE